MQGVNFERWSRACRDVGVAPEERDYRRIRRGWHSMGRHYHTLSHLDACLHELDEAHALALRPAEVELALWFHDAVYRSWRNDNEARSASLAAELLRAAAPDVVERIRQMILATGHHDEDLAGDTALVTDVDLAILGQPPDVYAGFAIAVRREYWWVPRSRYVAARAGVLDGFLARFAIYRHDWFHDRYEKQARENLLGELAQLTERCA